MCDFLFGIPTSMWVLGHKKPRVTPYAQSIYRFLRKYLLKVPVGSCPIPLVPTRKHRLPGTGETGNA